VRRVRSGNVTGHRRMMRTSTALVGLFLVSYVVKVLLIGREDRSTWDDASLWMLYVHEFCIALMILAAGAGLSRARRFGRLRDGDVLAPEARARDRRIHRIAGRVALVASAAALLTAGGVLAGMFARAGV
jgi:uncharacterized membrane protein YozB (DUF420 family)